MIRLAHCRHKKGAVGWRPTGELRRLYPGGPGIASTLRVVLESWRAGKAGVNRRHGPGGSPRGEPALWAAGPTRAHLGTSCLAPQTTVSSNSVTVWLTSGEPANLRLGPAGRAPRFEPRTRWPRRSPCASPHTLIRGQPGVRLDLDLCYLSGRPHLSIVTLKRVV